MDSRFCLIKDLVGCYCLFYCTVREEVERSSSIGGLIVSDVLLGWCCVLRVACCSARYCAIVPTTALLPSNAIAREVCENESV